MLMLLWTKFNGLLTIPQVQSRGIPEKSALRALSMGCRTFLPLGTLSNRTHCGSLKTDDSTPRGALFNVVRQTSARRHPGVAEDRAGVAEKTRYTQRRGWGFRALDYASALADRPVAFAVEVPGPA
jgi:hypothetical protein